MEKTNQNRIGESRAEGVRSTPDSLALKANAPHSLHIGELRGNDGVGELSEQSPSKVERCSVRPHLQRRLDELRMHPSYACHHVAVPAPQIAVLEALGDLAFREPIVITPDGTVIAGYARWQLARHQGRGTILCVSAGQVTKVKQLIKTAEAAIEQAVRDGEISIHKAWLWSYDTPSRQLEKLRLWRIDKGIKAKAKSLVVQHQAQLQGHSRDPRFFTVEELVNVVNSLSSSFVGTSHALSAPLIAILDVPGPGIFITRDLIDGIKEQERGSAK